MYVSTRYRSVRIDLNQEKLMVYRVDIRFRLMDRFDLESKDFDRKVTNYPRNFSMEIEASNM